MSQILNRNVLLPNLNFSSHSHFIKMAGGSKLADFSTSIKGFLYCPGVNLLKLDMQTKVFRNIYGIESIVQ